MCLSSRLTSVRSELGSKVKSSLSEQALRTAWYLWQPETEDLLWDAEIKQHEASFLASNTWFLESVQYTDSHISNPFSLHFTRWRFLISNNIFTIKSLNRSLQTIDFPSLALKLTFLPHNPSRTGCCHEV